MIFSYPRFDVTRERLWDCSCCSKSKYGVCSCFRGVWKNPIILAKRLNKLKEISILPATLLVYQLIGHRRDMFIHLWHYEIAHIFQRDDVWVLPVSQENLNLLRWIFLGLVNDLKKKKKKYLKEQIGQTNSRKQIKEFLSDKKIRLLLFEQFHRQWNRVDENKSTKVTSS